MRIQLKQVKYYPNYPFCILLYKDWTSVLTKCYLLIKFLTMNGLPVTCGSGPAAGDDDRYGSQ
jgi:hypothetical protein